MLKEYIEQFDLTDQDTGEVNQVQVTIDMHNLVVQMGARAIKAPGGVCKDGHVRVRHIRPKKGKPDGKTGTT